MPFSPPEDLPDPGIEPAFPVSPALAGGFFTTGEPRAILDPVLDFLGLVYPCLQKGLDIVSLVVLPNLVSGSLADSFCISFLGCHNQVPQTEWLYQKRYIVSVPQARSPKSWFLLKNRRGGSVSGLSQ